MFCVSEAPFVFIIDLFVKHASAQFTYKKYQPNNVSYLEPYGLVRQVSDDCWDVFQSNKRCKA